MHAQTLPPTPRRRRSAPDPTLAPVSPDALTFPLPLGTSPSASDLLAHWVTSALVPMEAERYQRVRNRLADWEANTEKDKPHRPRGSDKHLTPAYIAQTLTNVLTQSPPLPPMPCTFCGRPVAHPVPLRWKASVAKQSFAFGQPDRMRHGGAGACPACWVSLVMTAFSENPRPSFMVWRTATGVDGWAWDPSALDQHAWWTIPKARPLAGHYLHRHGLYQRRPAWFLAPLVEDPAWVGFWTDYGFADQKPAQPGRVVWCPVEVQDQVAQAAAECWTVTEDLTVKLPPLRRAWSDRFDALLTDPRVAPVDRWALRALTIQTLNRHRAVLEKAAKLAAETPAASDP